ncbi:MAG TPA: MerR family transcriptional regulator [Acidimicrobiales bacterium]|nr:MerR family transcriptional regulator [Acidimicrobiales bacterium]
MAKATRLRLDDLAREARVPSTTIRLYRTKGLLPPPVLEGRTGWYDESHVARLRLIARLQEEGHSLAGIAELLRQWEEGRSLDAVVGVETELDALLGERNAIVVSPAQLLSRFPDSAMTPELMQRAGRLGLIALTDSGEVRVTDRRFLDTGAALAALGVPLDVVLDEWQALTALTDKIATRFINVFEAELAPTDWQRNLTSARAKELAATLGQLQAIARQVVVAALDASVAKVGRRRLSDLLESLDAP